MTEGVCAVGGCNEAKLRYRSGQYSSYCRVHKNEKKRLSRQKRALESALGEKPLVIVKERLVYKEREGAKKVAIVDAGWSRVRVCELVEVELLRGFYSFYQVDAAVKKLRREGCEILWEDEEK